MAGTRCGKTHPRPASFMALVAALEITGGHGRPGMGAPVSAVVLRPGFHPMPMFLGCHLAWDTTGIEK